MFTAEIIKVGQSVDQKNSPVSMADITLSYKKDGVEVLQVTERVSDLSKIKTIAQNALNELKRQEDIANYILSQPLGVIDFTPPALTDEQIANNAYNQKRQQLIQLKQDLDLGLTDQTTFDAALNDAVTAKPVSITATPLTP